MTEEIRVKGLDELQAFLDQLPAKIERNIMRGALRAGMKPVQQVAKRGIHSVSGKLAEGLSISTRAKDHTVTASLKTKGEHGSVAHLVEYGTHPHFIHALHGRALGIPGLLTVRASVQHPGAQPKPFMRPALDSQAQPAVFAVAEYIKARLTKEGLDAAPVSIQGDE